MITIFSEDRSKNPTDGSPWEFTNWDVDKDNVSLGSENIQTNKYAVLQGPSPNIKQRQRGRWIAHSGVFGTGVISMPQKLHFLCKYKLSPPTTTTTTTTAPTTAPTTTASTSTTTSDAGRVFAFSTRH